MEKDLINIINISTFAPSGDNSQPWRFKIKNNIVRVYNIPEKDTSLYNFNMYTSMIAIGSLIENMKIYASHLGYICDISLNGNNKDNLVATCSFSKNSKVKEDSLYKYIDKRQTNRKEYSNKKIEPEVLIELNKIKNSKDINIKIIENNTLVEKLADIASLNEQIVLENRKLHDFLFEKITWNEKEDKIKKGFYIKTLELKGPQIFVFKLLRSWKINNYLNKIGISKFVAKDNARIYKHSAAILSITSNELNKESFIKTGMTSQRLWLTLTKHSIYMQPLTGIIFLNHRVNLGYDKEFTEEHINIIKKSYLEIEKIMESKHKFITFMFRLGYADKPSASTKREEAELIIEK